MSSGGTIQQRQPSPSCNFSQQEGLGKNPRRGSLVCLSQGREDQQRCKTKQSCTVSCTSKSSPTSVTACQVLFILPPRTMCPPWVLCQMCVCLTQHHSATHHWKYFGTFLLWSPDKRSSTTQLSRTNNVCHYQRFLHPMSFHMLAVAENPSPVSALAKYSFTGLPLPFTFVYFRKTLLHIFAPAKQHPTQLTLQ